MNDLILLTLIAGILLVFCLVKLMGDNEEFAEVYALILILGIALTIASGIAVLNNDSSENKEQNYSYKAIQKSKIKKFPKCYSENGHSVCETEDGDVFVVEDFWKIDQEDVKGNTK